MNTVIVIEGIVTKVERSTNGYGESERVVGIDVAIQSRWEELDPADGSTSPYIRTSTIHLPKGFRQPMVGSKLTLVLEEGNDGVDEVAREEIAKLIAEEPDEPEVDWVPESALDDESQYPQETTAEDMEATTDRSQG